jgi:uncharacterized protein (DUF1800 family)
MIFLPFPLPALGKKDKPVAAISQMDAQKSALHALNRLTFGPRPGDVERVTGMGVGKWIDLQLHPEKIDDSALDARLAPLRTLRMDNRELVENFPPQPVIKAVADGKLGMPSDPVKRAVYMAQLARYQQRLERKQNAAEIKPAAMEVSPSGSQPAASQTSGSLPPKTMASEAAQETAAMMEPDDRPRPEAEARDLAGLPPDQRFRALLKLPTEEQIALATAKGNARERLMEGLDPKQRETFLAFNNPQQVVTEELMDGKLLRDIYSERQLQEVMTDFWFNHFNVFVGKGADRYMLTSYERDVIGPHALGKFEDLLVATAQSPAMLFYLDNWLSTGPNSDFALGVPKNPSRGRGRVRRIQFPRAKARRGGLNENYGRELMELHTLGVNGGYTQKDVTEVARVFTGWTLKEPREGGGFFFDERKHDPGDKTVLGHRIKPKGEKEGLEVLHLLARNPSTAKFISTKLAVRFVSDDPPPALVERMSKTFLKKNGDIREVMKTMLESPEFWSPQAYRSKVKTPIEFVASAVRASGAEVSDALPLARELQNMGMQLYGAQPPTGYSMKAETWVNSSALLGRMNFALALAAGRIKGTQVDTLHLLPGQISPSDGQQALTALESSLLSGDVSQQTHGTIAARLQDPKVSQRRLDDPARAPNLGLIAGLLMGSPEFQRR